MNSLKQTNGVGEINNINISCNKKLNGSINGNQLEGEETDYDKFISLDSEGVVEIIKVLESRLPRSGHVSLNLYPVHILNISHDYFYPLSFNVINLLAALQHGQNVHKVLSLD